MRKLIIISMITVLALVSIYFFVWNGGYNIRLTQVTESDLDGLTNFSFEAVMYEKIEEREAIVIIVADNWIRFILDEYISIFNTEEMREYHLHEREQIAYALPLSEENIRNPKEMFFSFNHLFEERGSVRWRLIGTEMIDGNECYVYVTRLRDGSVRLYRLVDRNIYVKVIRYDIDGNQVRMHQLRNLRLSGVTEDEVRVPEGFEIVDGSLWNEE